MWEVIWEVPRKGDVVSRRGFGGRLPLILKSRDGGRLSSCLGNYGSCLDVPTVRRYAGGSPLVNDCWSGLSFRVLNRQPVRGFYIILFVDVLFEGQCSVYIFDISHVPNYSQSFTVLIIVSDQVIFT